MQSKNSSANQEAKPSFIELARRKQIIEATITVLAEHGYMNTTFARIGKQAGISPSLISYHFKDKEELTQEVLLSLSKDRVAVATQAIADVSNARDKLITLLEADIANMGTQPHHFQAMVEVLFGMRGVKGSMTYLGDNEDPAFTLVLSILEEGKQNGTFGDIDCYNLAIIIDGARDTFLAQLAMRPGFSLEKFTKTLTTFVLQAVQKA